MLSPPPHQNSLKIFIRDLLWLYLWLIFTGSEFTIHLFMLSWEFVLFPDIYWQSLDLFFTMYVYYTDVPNSDAGCSWELSHLVIVYLPLQLFQCNLHFIYFVIYVLLIYIFLGLFHLHICQPNYLPCLVYEPQDFTSLNFNIFLYESMA